ncbi:unnamed protein product [Linum tenue]|uniref:Uncharacterized protein n=2 Tax=Linum tenue TaxID=586396 RepID=A0AAV0GZP3_9ROSI|nr:unnamed protein product [Linum tenue]
MEAATAAKKKTKNKKKKEESTVRKGTWKAEEDQVLIRHVEKYGPREWSSIRSKGLLQRTGKSCRLRWVNKLQPNLKTGCKFTEEEARVVIELQARYGNRWAKIATHLTGRTDNDVKNFWSSRQKRLARILRTTSAPPACSASSRKRNSPASASASGNLISLPESSRLRPSMEEETPVKTVSFCDPKSEAGEEVVGPSLKVEPVEISEAAISFPEMKAEPLGAEDFIAFSPESQEILAGLGVGVGDNPFHLFDIFGSAGDGGNNLIAHPHHQLLDPKLPGAGGGHVNDINNRGGGGFNDVGGEEDEDYLPTNYVFDDIDDLPSPSKW